MIGCLGGLGRSLTKWMVSCRARRFIFPSCTATEKSAAKLLVESLYSQGVDVKLVRGDVGIYEDAERCLQAIIILISGVIQAAMVLDEII
jgi:KR domain